MFKAILSFSFLLCMVSFAHAGQLFPPSGASGGVPCSGGKVLGWTGSGVKCIDPSPGVSTDSCPAGQVVSKVTKGKVECIVPPLTTGCGGNSAIQRLTNGQASCISIESEGIGGGTSTPLSISCPSGKFLKGISNGNPICEAVKPAFGGIYNVARYPSGAVKRCRYANPLTGRCSCPSGYTAKMFWEFANLSCNRDMRSTLSGIDFSTITNHQYHGHGYYSDGGRNFNSDGSCRVAMYACYLK